MSNEELWQLFPIILKPYNPKYMYWYREEKQRLLDYLGDDLVLRINHIGSTSVHGLLAKPTVDILVEVKDESHVNQVKVLMDKHNDYICLTKKDGFKAPSIFCMKGYTEQGFSEQVYHIHVRIMNDHKELYFRDYLQDHPDVAQAYGTLKISLMKKYKHHRDHYTEEKSAFINKYTTIAKMIYPNRYKPMKSN